MPGFRTRESSSFGQPAATGRSPAPLRTLSTAPWLGSRSLEPLRPTLNTGLLGRPWRPSVARTARSLEWLSGGLRPRCSGERRPPSQPEKPGWGALPVECPVASLCERRSSPGCCAGTMTSPARPEEVRRSLGRTRRPTATIHRRVQNSASTGRAVSDDFWGQRATGCEGRSVRRSSERALSGSALGEGKNCGGEAFHRRHRQNDDVVTSSCLARMRPRQLYS